MKTEYNPQHAFINSTHAPAANTAAVVTLAARAGERRVVTQIDYSLAGTVAAAALLSVTGLDESNYNVTLPIAVQSGQLFFQMEPLRGLVNTAVVVTLATGGASATGIINVIHDP